ncbi:MAG: sugar ABC transporter substrate-binding protein [Rhodobacteraceae bacterium CG17_big_fil_post_rev_8_21_14_2_50_65_11]|nr:MAG: sugar ABC transporter substrate-binding protein [Rhodobacteraceae bacterium CG17_big_fil_post_rev_8_21_14_2_50_65_11]
MKNIRNEYLLGGKPVAAGRSPFAPSEMLQAIDLIEDFASEIESTLDVASPNPHLNMALHLVKNHLEGRISTASSVIAASAVPYATARRKLAELQEAGLIETRPRTKSGKSFSLHPSALLLGNWGQLSDRLLRMAKKHVGDARQDRAEVEYYFGGTYQVGRSIQPPKVLPEPLSLSGGLRILVHGDPTFMVMESLKRQFEQVVGTKISQRAFSIDRLHEEALRNGERPTSRYDIIAVDLPWIGEFVSKGLLTPLDAVLDTDALDPGDFHTAGWRAAHWAGRPYGVPSQTTPELMFYRKDWFAEAGLEPPHSTDGVLQAARALHDPKKGRCGIAWNAARGTALGHTFMMTCADFGQPILNLDPISGGYDAADLDRDDIVPTIDTPRALEAAEYLMALLEFSPPDILSMSWYERIRPYAAGKIAMAYGYTLLAPYFELDETSPANGNTGYLPHPAGPSGHPIAPVGGYVLCIPANLPEARKREAAKALVAFTSPEAQKLYIQHGSRTAPRYSVGADPDVRQLSPIFEAVDAMSWRDELQFWPRPPVPQINELIAICGQEIHDMLRGVTAPRDTLARAQARAEQVMKDRD